MLFLGNIIIMTCSCTHVMIVNKFKQRFNLGYDENGYQNSKCLKYIIQAFCVTLEHVPTLMIQCALGRKQLGKKDYLAQLIST